MYLNSKTPYDCFLQSLLYKSCRKFLFFSAWTVVMIWGEGEEGGIYGQISNFKSDVDSITQIKYISGMQIQTTVSFPQDSFHLELEK